MTTGLTHSTYVTQIATMAVVPEDDVNFVAILPQMITYAENRIYRKLDFIQVQQTLTSRSTAANTQSVTLGSDANTPDFVVLQEVNVITPAGTTDPVSGTIIPLLPASKEFLRWVYPSSSSAGTPQFFAPLTQTDILLGPWPNAIFTLQTVGTTRPASLSASNTTTFISTYLPDILIMASMIYISAFQRNFGRMSDDPQMSVTYEQQFNNLCTDAMIEEARKKFQASAWTSQSPPAAATPSR